MNTLYSCVQWLFVNSNLKVYSHAGCQETPTYSCLSEYIMAVTEPRIMKEGNPEHITSHLSVINFNIIIPLGPDSAEQSRHLTLSRLRLS